MFFFANSCQTVANRYRTHTFVTKTSVFFICDFLLTVQRRVRTACVYTRYHMYTSSVHSVDTYIFVVVGEGGVCFFICKVITRSGTKNRVRFHISYRITAECRVYIIYGIFRFSESKKKNPQPGLEAFFFSKWKKQNVFG